MIGRITHGWIIVATAVLGIMVSFGSLVVFSFGVFLKPLSAQFHWDRADISLGFSLSALSVALASPLIGRIVDRVGARRVILPCVTVYGLAFCALAMLHGALWQFYATYIVIGVVGNGTTQLCYAKVITAWFDDRRGIALATMMAGVGVGAMAVPPLATWLIETLGWRDAYLALGAAILVLGILPAAFFLQERPPGARAEKHTAAHAIEGLTTREAARTGVYQLLLTAFFLFSIAVNGTVAHLVPMLTDRGFSPERAAFAASILGGATLAGRLLTGTLLDRFHGARVAGLFFGIASVGVVVASLAHTLAVAYVGTTLIGFGMGAEADVMPYLISRYFGLRSFSELFGYSFTAYAIAGALGPWVMGRSYDQFHSYSTAMLLLGGAMFAGATILACLPRYSRTLKAAEAAA
ncbi:MAG TPA: MFS transporter [Bryobacteraceae bacterium]|nr:MFS transporter [Bryobacteraceae bacterium]